jgi:hypothetical protein
MASVIAVFAAVAALIAACCAMVWGRRWRARRAFDAEYARLVEETTIDPGALRGPGTTLGAEPPAAEAARLAAGPLSAADLQYYAHCWKHIESEFGQSPAAALDLAEHLTANLLLTRHLAPADAPEPSELPETWSFPSARGYRQAQEVCARALAVRSQELQEQEQRGQEQPEQPEQEQELPSSRLRTALGLYRAFFEEILALPDAHGSEI